jgi:hypothetical protein
MKYNLFLLSAIIFVGCSKQSNTNTSSNNSNTSTSSLTPQEQALVGNWIVKRIASVNQAADTVTNYLNYNNPSQCHLELKSSIWNNTSGTYESIDGLGCSPYTSNWKYMSPSQIQLGPAIYAIKYQSADSLIIQYNSGRYYLKK